MRGGAADRLIGQDGSCEKRRVEAAGQKTDVHFLTGADKNIPFEGQTSIMFCPPSLYVSLLLLHEHWGVTNGGSWMKGSADGETDGGRIPAASLLLPHSRSPLFQQRWSLCFCSSLLEMFVKMGFKVLLAIFAKDTQILTSWTVCPSSLYGRLSKTTLFLWQHS